MGNNRGIPVNIPHQTYLAVFARKALVETDLIPPGDTH
jgi:hypothetical protein